MPVAILVVRAQATGDASQHMARMMRFTVRVENQEPLLVRNPHQRRRLRSGDPADPCRVAPCSHTRQGAAAPSPGRPSRMVWPMLSPTGVECPR